MDTQPEIREHLRELLEGRFAHLPLEAILEEFPIDKINVRLENAPHTAWELLEHIRLAQRDILEFSRDASHVSPEFPDGYWNTKEGTAADWRSSVETISAELQAIRDLVADEKTICSPRFRTATGRRFSAKPCSSPITTLIISVSSFC